ncbi:hypothetical protein WDW86_02080, partial [Bdellovibrionota bacterium FG-2]
MKTLHFKNTFLIQGLVKGVKGMKGFLIISVGKYTYSEGGLAAHRSGLGKTLHTFHSLRNSRISCGVVSVKG